MVLAWVRGLLAKAHKVHTDLSRQHQPLHALMILIREVDQSSDSSYAEECRDIVDEAFSVCGPAGGLIGTEDHNLQHQFLTEGGREAWDFLCRLRSKAWQKHDVDPDILWTREEVTKRSYARADQMMKVPDAEYPQGEISNQHPPPGIRADPQPPSTQTTAETAHEPLNEDIFANSGSMTNTDWQEWDSLVAGSQSGDIFGFLGFGLSPDQ